MIVQKNASLKAGIIIEQTRRRFAAAPVI